MAELDSGAFDVAADVAVGEFFRIFGRPATYVVAVDGGRVSLRAIERTPQESDAMGRSFFSVEPTSIDLAAADLAAAPAEGDRVEFSDGRRFVMKGAPELDPGRRIWRCRAETAA